MERNIIYLIDGLRTPLLDGVFSFVSASCFLIVPLVILYLLRKRDTKAYPLMLSLILTLLAVTAIKENIVASRPCSELPLHVLACDDPVESFPSMHTALAFAPVVFLLPDLPVFLAYLAYALLVGFSRVYLGMHYLHDILAGGAISILFGIACLKAQKILSAKKVP